MESHSCPESSFLLLGWCFSVHQFKNPMYLSIDLLKSNHYSIALGFMWPGLSFMGQVRAIGTSLMVKTWRHRQVGQKGLFPCCKLLWFYEQGLYQTGFVSLIFHNSYSILTKYPPQPQQLAQKSKIIVITALQIWMHKSFPTWSRQMAFSLCAHIGEAVT